MKFRDKKMLVLNSRNNIIKKVLSKGNVKVVEVENTSHVVLDQEKITCSLKREGAVRLAQEKFPFIKLQLPILYLYEEMLGILTFISTAARKMTL